jgi:16S rRNA (guanine(966)-N(2))-methyltransferase RsmD
VKTAESRTKNRRRGHALIRWLFVRVIAGEARGRKLLAPEGLGTRPTADRARETLFNILQAEIPGAAVLDLFAGSGAAGVEALSRGARRAAFVDNSAAACAVIRKNLENTRLVRRAEVFAKDAFGAIKALAARGETFDVIIADPPYYSGLGGAARALILDLGVLSPGGVFVCETAKDEAFPAEAEARRCGAACFWFCRT